MDLKHGDMVANIRAALVRASAEQTEAGMQWYPTAFRLVDAISAMTGINTERVTFALAALSPRNPWNWNVADAYTFAAARAEGRTMPKATTFTRNRLAAWQALDYGTDPWVSAALKVRDFVAAINGDEQAVVVDTWAFIVATDRRPKGAVRPKEYVKVAAAYREVAREFGMAPRDVQAITWLVARTEGTARSTSNSNSIKAGTPEFLRAMLREEARA